MKKQPIFLAALILFAGSTTSALAATVKFDGRVLKVNNQPYLVEGVNASVYPIGTFPTQFGVCWWDPNQPSSFMCPTPKIENAHDIDALVQTMMAGTAYLNANTYRTFGKIAVQPSPMLKRAKEYNVMVIMGYWVDWNLDFTFPGTAGAAQRQQLIKDYADYIKWLKRDTNYGQVLMIGLSNENNLHWCSWANQSQACTQCSQDAQAAGFYDLVNDMAAAGKANDSDPRPVIIVSAALGDIGNSTRHANDARLTNIDGWGVNSYAGNTFGNIFSQFAQKSNKGLIITEFGMDAYDHRPTPTATFGGINEDIQEQYIEAQWREIKTEYAKTNGVVSGGVIFHIADGWFGDDSWTIGVTQHNPSAGGWYSGAFPDGKLDNEFLGLFERRPGPYPFIDTFVPRKAATKVQSLFK